jgi:hypothetical protein
VIPVLAGSGSDVVTWRRCPAPGLRGLAAMLIVILAGMPVISNATVFHATPGGSTCRSSGCECTLISPCQISRALYKRLSPGDVLRLGPGRYEPQIFRELQGSPAAPIVITGPTPRDGRSSGRAIFSGGGTRQDVLEIVGSKHLELRHLQVEGGGRSGVRVNNSHSITLRGLTLGNNRVWGVFTNHANNVTVLDSHIQGPGSQHGIYFSNSGDGGYIARNHISGFDGCGVQLNGDKSMGGADGVIGDGLIQNVVIEHNFIAANGAAGGAAINLDGARGTVIRGNLLVANLSAGIAMFRVDGSFASRETRILENLLIGTSQSRALLHIAPGAIDQFIADNAFVGLNPDSALIKLSVDDGAATAGAGGGSSLPATFVANRYLAAGVVADLGDSVIADEACGAWQPS